MSPLLGLARLISAMTALRPAAIFARSAFSNPRGGGASRAWRSISPRGTRPLASSTSRRFAARIRVRTSDTSGGFRELAREVHELIQLRARGARREGLASGGDSVPEAGHDARNIERGRRVENDHVARRARLVRENRLHARLRIGRVLDLDGLDRRHVEAELLRFDGVLGDEVVLQLRDVGGAGDGDLVEPLVAMNG